MAKSKHEKYYPKKQRKAAHTKRYALVGVIAFTIWLVGFIFIQVLDFGDKIGPKITLAWTVIMAVSAVAFNVIYIVNEIKKDMDSNKEE